ncbi:uncharacterized protein [Trachinotus anak]|uniref:uncharacterized protein isoform X2 n=1 Tax=Trachinotus anak TaxID=443729 RepID=UPI0039F1DF34
MSGFTGIQVSLFLKLLLHLTAVSGQDFSSFAVRVGDEVTLPCMYDQVKCDSTIWIFTHSLYPTVELVVQGKIGEDAKSKSDRLSVTENCSLVIKNVTAADGGLYTCRQFKSGEQQDPDQSQVDLSVVTMTEQKVDDEVVLFCSVFTYQQCSYTVQWLPTGTDVDKDHTAVGTSQSDCLATVAFRTLHHNQSNYHQLFKCEVRNRDGGNMQLFAFSLQSTGEGQRNNTTSREFNATTQEEQCRYTVQWLYEDGKGDSTSVETTSTTCSARVSFNTSHLHHKSKYKESVKCEVTDTHSRTLQLFNFTPQSSPEKTGLCI